MNICCYLLQRYCEWRLFSGTCVQFPTASCSQERAHTLPHGLFFAYRCNAGDYSTPGQRFLNTMTYGRMKLGR